MTEDGAGGLASKTFWLIVKYQNHDMEALTLGPEGSGSKKTLPVFSSAEEARVFLRFQAPASAGWTVRQSTVGELVSVLLGPCASARRVALDPLPIEVGGKAMVGLISLDRGKFLRNLVFLHEVSTLHLVSSSEGLCRTMLACGARRRAFGAGLPEQMARAVAGKRKVRDDG